MRALTPRCCSRAKITFMLERAPRGWLMYDVVVDDIGMVENYRAQFDRVIRTRGLSRLEANSG
jgi:ABC-type transporter MlaC component